MLCQPLFNMNLSKTRNVLFVVALLCSCIYKADQKDLSHAKPTPVVKKDFVRPAGQLSFRRSFAGVQFMNDEAAIDKYLAKQEKSNPLLTVPVRDSVLLGRLRGLQLMKGDELLIKKFTPLTAKRLEVVNQIMVPVKLFVDRTALMERRMIFLKDRDSIPFNAGLSDSIFYCLPGSDKSDTGKTLFVVNQYYVMNGYNFDLMLYEVLNDDQ